MPIIKVWPLKDSRDSRAPVVRQNLGPQYAAPGPDPQCRYTLACWQKQKVNKAMRRLGEQFFQALERGETNPLVVSEVSDAVKRRKM